MAMLNPIVAMLHNTATNRWHPILFVEAPLPGPNPSVVRHRSKGHHTTGFDARQDAEAHARGELAPKIEHCRLILDKVFEWDGQDMPAMNAFFD